MNTNNFTVFLNPVSVFHDLYLTIPAADKGCVRHCVENMQRAQDLSPLDLVEMFVTVFCFLKDSSEVSHVLLDDFKSCQGYTYLSEFILR